MSKMKFDDALATFLALPPEHAVLIRGHRGIGKSTLIANFAKTLRERTGKEYPLIDRRLAQMTEGDMLGLPSIVDGTTTWNPPDFIRMACDVPCVLNLDELNRARREVQNVALQLSLDRELSSGVKLHPETYVFSSINLGNMYQVERMDAALLDRFFVVDLLFDFGLWLANERKEGIHSLWLDFLVGEPNWVNVSDDRSDINAKGTSPRSASKCGRALSPLLKAGEEALATATSPNQPTFNKDLIYRIVGGFLGMPAAAAFDGFLKGYIQKHGVVTGEMVFEDWIDVRKKLDLTRLDLINNVIDKFLNHVNSLPSTPGMELTPRQGKNFQLLLEDIPREQRPLIYQRLLKGKRARIDILLALHKWGERLLLEVYGTKPGKEGLNIVPNIPGLTTPEEKKAG